MMGNVYETSYDIFPAQSQRVGRPASVSFVYDLRRILRGTIVRDDLEAPFETIII